MVKKIELEKIELELYAVCNKDGEFMRSKGYGGSGSKWVDDIKKARIYPRIGTARSQVTYWAKHYPEYDTPKIVKLLVTGLEIVDETERISKAQRTKAKADLEFQLKNIKHQLELKKGLQKKEKEIRAQLEDLDSDVIPVC